MAGVGYFFYDNHEIFCIVRGKEEFVRYSDVCDALKIKHPYKALKKYESDPSSVCKGAGEFFTDFSVVVENIEEYDLFINTWMMSLICSAYGGQDLMCKYIDFIKEGHEQEEVEIKEYSDTDSFTAHVIEITGNLEEVLEAFLKVLDSE